MNKYRNKKTQVDMYVFDSIAESKRYKELALLQRAGEIIIVEDVKGKETDVFKLKHKLFEKKYPDLTLKIIK